MLLKYGSDPLKTYLPDSDIDITVIPVLSSFEEKKEGQSLGTMSALHQLKT
jgi:predicted nucleotidyltransferase